MSCADPTLGTLGLTGTLGGVNATSFADAASRKDPAQYNWQWTTYLTNKAALDGHYGGMCARYRARQRVASEIWLFPSLIGARTNIALGDYGYCPPPPTPITLSAVGDTATYSADGLSYWTAPVKFVVFSSGCREGKPVAATGGTITFTNLVEPYTWDPANPHQNNGEQPGGIVEATFDDVTFPSGQNVSGGVVAPFCSLVGCPTPPSSWQCVS